jgi:hypothetical protein
MTENALYYPYIHIRDVNWLKATLLLFSQVKRMVPTNSTPADTPDVKLFTHFPSDMEPLIAPAQLDSCRVIEAQKYLANKLLCDANNPEFERAFGKETARQELPADGFGFQIHQSKLSRKLREALRESNLAWKPGQFEPYSFSTEYIELHPRVGQAVMATLAIACAKSEGLDIVGDSRSEGLHKCLLEKDSHSVYETWLNLDTRPPDPPAATGRELFEFLVGFACDVSNLQPSDLAAMRADREPIRKLMSRLNEHAKNIDPMDEGPRRVEQFKDEATAILKAWRQDRANMSAFWRQFFGHGLADAGVKFFEKVADKTVAGAGLGAIPGLTFGSLAMSGIVGAAAGLSIGLVAHAGRSMAAIRKTERESLYRYLTLLGKAGVEFRSV